jgi:hypothetical protein
MEQEFITPTHVKEYVFCPMLFYNKYVVGLLEPKNRDNVRRLSRVFKG